MKTNPAAAAGRLRPAEIGAASAGRSVAVYGAVSLAVVALFVAQSLTALNTYQWGGNPLVVALTTATGWIIRAAVALPFFVWMHRHPIRAEHWQRSAFRHALAMPLFVLVENVACWSAERILPYLKRHTLAEVLASEAHLDILTYAVLLGAVQAQAYFRALQAREREARELALSTARLEAQLAEARLAALRMQLQPHFLFNALNAISALIHSEPDVADRMLERLSDLLRHVLQHDGAPELPLRQELEIVESYLAMQQMRFGERLRVERELDPESLDACVPALILQPLVENAIRHGIELRAGSGHLVLRAQKRHGLLYLEVEDDGPGVSEESESRSFGIGLANARARLEQLHGAAAALDIERVPHGGTRVIVGMPWRTCEVAG